MYTADRRIYINGPREDPNTRVVDEGAEDAAELLVAEGGTLTDDVAARFGLSGTTPQNTPGTPQSAPQGQEAGVLSSQSIQPAEPNSPVGGAEAGRPGGEQVRPLQVGQPAEQPAKAKK